MTFEETKDLLEDLRRARKRVSQVNKEIEYYVSIKSSLNPQRGGGGNSSPVESVVLRIEREQLKLAEAVQDMFDIEDSIAEALDSLTSVERDIIVGCYMRGRKHYQLAAEFNYSVSYIEKIKPKAIRKIAKNTKSAD